MIIPRAEIEISVSTFWIIEIEIKHLPTGLVGRGQDEHSSRKAFAKAHEDLENKLILEQTNAGLLREKQGIAAVLT